MFNGSSINIGISTLFSKVLIFWIIEYACKSKYVCKHGWTSNNHWTFCMCFWRMSKLKRNIEFDFEFDFCNLNNGANNMSMINWPTKDQLTRVYWRTIDTASPWCICREHRLWTIIALYGQTNKQTIQSCFVRKY